MKRKRLIAAFPLLCLVIITAGCGGTDVIAAEDIRDELVKAINMGNLETYRMDMNMNSVMNMNIPNDEFGEGTMSTSMVATGVVDYEDLNMIMEMSMTTDMPSLSDAMESMEMAVYLISGVYYMKMDIPSEGESWLKFDIPEEYWEDYKDQMDQMAQQIDLMEYADVELLGTEAVNGIECYVLDIKTDFASLYEAMLQQLEIGNTIPNEFPLLSLEDIITDYSYKSWISKDEYFLMKYEMSYTMTMDSESMGLPPEEAFAMTMEMDATVVISNHNQPVSIELPPEALNAEEVPMLNSDSWY